MARRGYAPDASLITAMETGGGTWSNLLSGVKGYNTAVKEQAERDKIERDKEEYNKKVAAEDAIREFAKNPNLHKYAASDTRAGSDQEAIQSYTTGNLSELMNKYNSMESGKEADDFFFKEIDPLQKQLQANYENVPLFQKDVIQGVTNELLAKNVPTAQALQMAQTQAAGLPSRAEMLESQKAAIKEWNAQEKDRVEAANKQIDREFTTAKHINDKAVSLYKTNKSSGKPNGTSTSQDVFALLEKGEYGGLDKGAALDVINKKLDEGVPANLIALGIKNGTRVDSTAGVTDKYLKNFEALVDGYYKKHKASGYTSNTPRGMKSDNYFKELLGKYETAGYKKMPTMGDVRKQAAEGFRRNTRDILEGPEVGKKGPLDLSKKSNTVIVKNDKDRLGDESTGEHGSGGVEESPFGKFKTKEEADAYINELNKKAQDGVRSDFLNVKKDKQGTGTKGNPTREVKSGEFGPLELMSAIAGNKVTITDHHPKVRTDRLVHLLSKANPVEKEMLEESLRFRGIDPTNYKVKKDVFDPFQNWVDNVLPLEKDLGRGKETKVNTNELKGTIKAVMNGSGTDADKQYNLVRLGFSAKQARETIEKYKEDQIRRAKYAPSF